MKLKSHFLPLLTGFLCVAIMLWQWTRFFDLDPEDEALYVAYGITNFRDPAWAPLYGFYYHLISFLTPNPIQVYAINFVLIAFGIFISIYILTYDLTKSPVTALLMSLFSFCTGANLGIIPKVQLFNFCFLFCLFFVIHRRTENRWRLWLFYIVMTASIYLRQDNIIYLFAILGYDLWRFRKRELGSFLLSAYIWMMLIICTAGVLLDFVGNPFQQDRTWRAFADHFVWRNPEMFSLWPTTLSNGEMVSHTFHYADSIASALRNNPLLFLQYTFQNLIDTPSVFLATLQLQPGPFSQLIFTFSALILFLFLALMSKESVQYPAKETRNFIFFFVGATLLKVAMTCSLLNPDPKYLIELVLMTPALVAFLVHTFCVPRWKKNWKIFSPIVVCGIAVLFAILIRFGLEPRYQYQSGQRDTISIVTSIAKAHQSQLIMAPGGTTRYLANDFKTKLLRDFETEALPNQSLGNFMADKNVDLVVLEPAFFEEVKQSGAIEPYRNFLNQYAQAGFQQIKVDIPETFVFIKEK